MKKMHYKEGDWFAVPLRSGGFGVGKITRMTKKGKVLFGYFFGPKHESIPTIDIVKDFRPKDAVAMYRFGDLGLYKHEWAVIGSPLVWEREKWPMPAFYRKNPLDTDHHRRVIYSDDDPNKEILEEMIPFEMLKNLPEDGMLGSGAVEIDLGRILSN